MDEEKELLGHMLNNYKKLKEMFPNEPIYSNYYNNVKKTIKKMKEGKKITIIN